jgi:hypothetical protein
VRIYLYYLSIIVLINSCGVYSFSGASISSEIKTVTIANFNNTTASSPPSLSNNITEALKDRFNDQTSLSIVDNDGDLLFTGDISSYTIKPIAIQSNETAAQNRLTINIKVEYTNFKDNEFNYNTNFSRFRDYSSSEDISTIEDQLMAEIIEELVDDIFNKALANW